MFLINMLNTQHSKINLQSQSGYGKDLFLFVSNTLMSASWEQETTVKSLT